MKSSTTEETKQNKRKPLLGAGFSVCQKPDTVALSVSMSDSDSKGPQCPHRYNEERISASWRGHVTLEEVNLGSWTAFFFSLRSFRKAT